MLELWGMQGTSSLPSITGPLRPRVVATDKVLSMAQTELKSVLMQNWIAWNRTLFDIETLLMLNWIFWNRTVLILKCVWTKTILILNWILFVLLEWVVEMEGKWQYSCCFVGCWFQDLFIRMTGFIILLKKSNKHVDRNDLIFFFWLVVFYGETSLVGYLITNPAHTHTHTHTYIYIYIYNEWVLPQILFIKAKISLTQYYAWGRFLINAAVKLDPCNN